MEENAILINRQSTAGESIGPLEKISFLEHSITLLQH